MKPVLFVTGHAPAYRVAAFEQLHERENVEYALFGGRLAHGGGSTVSQLPFPHRHVHEHELYALAASGRYRAVVASTGGRLALPASWGGARRARVPLILWASLWAHPRSAAHALSYPALLRLYRSADAIVTYGPHVSAYVRARGARRVQVAPQAVDNAFWGSSDAHIPTDPEWPKGAAVKFLFAGRPAREKGLGVLEEAWSMSGLQAPTAALVLVGAGSTPPWVPAGGAVARFGQEGAVAGLEVAYPEQGGAVARFAPVTPVELRNFYRGLRCFGGAIDSDAHLPRAVGTRGERGNEPGTSSDRERRSRRRGRRLGERWAQRLGDTRRGRRGPGRRLEAARARSRPARSLGRRRTRGRGRLYPRGMGRRLRACARRSGPVRGTVR